MSIDDGTPASAQKTVIVLGGGVAGLSAAHELVERGFKVRVFEERSIPGGKARSVAFPSTGRDRNVGTVHLGSRGRLRRDLPGEHGFRFFPRFYKHIIDTMARIPYRNTRTVADNLVDTTGTVFARFDKRPLKLPNVTPQMGLRLELPELYAAATDIRTLFGPDLGISPEEFAVFGEKVWQILTSCRERRMAEYEKIGWWQFIDAANHSDAYQKLFGIGCTRSVVAAQAKLASTKTIGDMFVQYFFNLAEPNVGADRVLNGPTNDVWIDPWLDYLRSRGVEYNVDSRVRSIDCHGNSITGVTIEHERNLVDVAGDYYISALPVEVMARLTTDRMVHADPSLANIFPLSKNVDWMNGIQFYLSEDTQIGPGHQIYLDSPWALTSISQHQFWPDVDLSRYADGQIRGILSVVISDWDTPGLNGKTARECTRTEVRDEVWDQLKRSLNVQGAQVLQDEDLRHWYLDASIDPVMGANAEPLLVNLVDTWRLRPTAATAIPNLMLAADYVQTSTDLACMEGANEAARRAVNAILRHAGAEAPPCRVWDLHEPVLLEPVRAYDRLRFRQGLPWDDMRIRFALSALSALQRGTLALQGLIRESIGAQSHVEDVLSYLGTGESRSVLVERLTSSREPSAELLRAFAELTRSAVSATSDAAASPTVQALTSAVENLTPSSVSTLPAANVRFVEP